MDEVKPWEVEDSGRELLHAVIETRFNQHSYTFSSDGGGGFQRSPPPAAMPESQMLSVARRDFRQEKSLRSFDEIQKPAKDGKQNAVKVRIAGFFENKPQLPSPYGISRAQLYDARWRALGACCVFLALTVMFVVIGTVSFWKDRMDWQKWFTLFSIIIMLSVLVLDIWNISLTFFVTNTMLLLVGIISLREALAGFSNEGILSTAVMFTISKAIEKTGLLNWVVRNVLRHPRSLQSALLRMLPAVAFWSAWTNNTPIVAVMIPVLETWSIRAALPLSKMLMPMSFSVILGGLCTIIGTSTTLVVQGLALPVDMGFFDIGAVGAPFTVVGLVIMILLGPLLLPAGTERRTYVSPVYSWVSLPENSPHVGKLITETGLGQTPGTSLLWLKPVDSPDAHFVPDLRGQLNDADRILPVLTRPLMAGDKLLFMGVRECVEDIVGTKIEWFKGSQLEGVNFFEIHLASTFPEAPTSVSQMNALFGCRIRRIHRNGALVHSGSGRIRDGTAQVQAGDILWVEGGYQILHLGSGDDARVKMTKVIMFSLGKVQSTLPLISRLHPYLAVLCLLFVVVVNAVGVFSIYEAGVIAIMVLLFTDTMSWMDIVDAIPGNLMIMICYSFALAAAVRNSGLGALIGEGFSRAFVGHEYVELLGMYLFSNALTAISPNSAVATIVYPVVVQVAGRGGFNIKAGLFCMGE